MPMGDQKDPYESLEPAKMFQRRRLGGFHFFGSAAEFGFLERRSAFGC